MRSPPPRLRCRFKTILPVEVIAAMGRIDERLREESGQMRETLNAASEAARRCVGHRRPAHTSLLPAPEAASTFPSMLPPPCLGPCPLPCSELGKLGLPGYLDANDGTGLPAAVWERVSKTQIEGGIRELERLFSTNAGTAEGLRVVLRQVLDGRGDGPVESLRVVLKGPPEPELPYHPSRLHAPAGVLDARRGGRCRRGPARAVPRPLDGRALGPRGCGPARRPRQVRQGGEKGGMRVGLCRHGCATGAWVRDSSPPLPSSPPPQVADVAEASSDGQVRSKLEANRARIAALSRSRAELDASIPGAYTPVSVRAGSAAPASEADAVRSALKAACAELQVRPASSDAACCLLLPIPASSPCVRPSSTRGL